MEPSSIGAIGTHFGRFREKKNAFVNVVKRAGTSSRQTALITLLISNLDPFPTAGQEVDCRQSAHSAKLDEATLCRTSENLPLVTLWLLLLWKFV
jgi:hypothetical protein